MIFFEKIIFLLMMDSSFFFFPFLVISFYYFDIRVILLCKMRVNYFPSFKLLEVFVHN